MSMTDFFASGDVRPFVISALILMSLFCVELLSLLFGFSVLGYDDGPEADLDLNAEASVETEFSFLSFLGIGLTPFGVWLVAFLLSFSLLGFSSQTLCLLLIDKALPAGISTVITLPFSVAMTKRLCTLFSRIVPSVTTEAVSEHSFGSRRGVVTNGIAKAGAPARVRVQDRFGRTHYLMAEPLSSIEEIQEGSEVLVIRDRRKRDYKLMQIND